MKNWIFLAIAICAEVPATEALKSSEAFTRMWPSLLTVLGYGISFYFLALTLRVIPVGIAYAMWSGAGIVLISLVAWAVHGQRLDAPALLGMGLIVAGAVVINVFSQGGAALARAACRTPGCIGGRGRTGKAHGCEESTHRPQLDYRHGNGPAENMHLNDPGNGELRAPHISESRSLPVEKHRSDIFFAAVETTRMPMTVTDPHLPDNPIVFANRAFLEMTGYSSEEIIGNNCRFLQGPETDPASVQDVRESIEQRREFATEVLNYRKDGSSFWNALFVSPVFDEQGNLVYFFGSQLDVSRRRDAEDALRQAQKMEALGQLTGGIAHDFNNLLQVMSGHLEVIQMMVSGDAARNAERIAFSAEHAATAAAKAATLTQQLLAFSRKQKLRGRVVNLNGLVSGMNNMAERTLGGGISLRQSLEEGLWNCQIDTTQAEVALLNVLINARDAMAQSERKEVTVQTQNVEITSHDLAMHHQLAPGRYVSIAVSDTGLGMPPEVASRVMEPFFTTKDEGQGTGLGLSMVYGFVKQSGGTVRIYSEVGEGTTVRLYFPASNEFENDLQAVKSRAIDKGGSETILVVEDKQDVAVVARMFLENAGYRILSAASGREAIELLEQHAEVDALFTDLIMPGGMNGVVLAREARRMLPRIKVLLTTGYADASIQRTDVGGAEFDVVNKPYTQKELLKRIRMLLDGPTGVG